jgi:solute carrier family 25 phosphate transporter 23/24/25/41
MVTTSAGDGTATSATTPTSTSPRKSDNITIQQPIQKPQHDDNNNNTQQDKQFLMRRFTLRSYPSVPGAEDATKMSTSSSRCTSDKDTQEEQEQRHRLELTDSVETVYGKESRLKEASKQLFCGGLAGSVAKTVTAPFSRLTILFQVHSMVTTKHHRPRFAMTIAGGARKIIERGGIRSMWKGNLTSVIHRFPYSGINFFIYENALDVLVQRRDEQMGSDSPAHDENSNHLNGGQGSISPFLRFMAGSLAGTTAVMACYPLDLVRTRITTDMHEHYKGIVDAFKKIGKAEGIRGYYSGLGATLLVAVPNFAVSYTAYGTLKEYVLDDDLFYNLRKIDVESGQERLGFQASLLCGAASGMTSTILTFPCDTVRRRMQIQNLHVLQEDRLNLTQHFSSIIRNEGPKGLYRGISPELMKVIPMVATMFTGYEWLKHQLDV